MISLSTVSKRWKPHSAHIGDMVDASREERSTWAGCGVRFAAISADVKN